MRPGAPWCTQCYAPAGASAADPAPTQRPGLSVGSPAGTWPCSACSQGNPLATEACEGCGTPFLAAARDPRPTVVLPVVGDVLALSPVGRVGLAVGIVVALLLLVTALLALLLA